FVIFHESHDQVANLDDSRRRREQMKPGVYRALTALLLLAPQTPMLFQGQEFGSTARFPFFAGHSKDLAAAVHKGRAEFLEQFPSRAALGIAGVPDPADPETLEAARLDWNERDLNGEIVALHRDLIALRKSDP